MLLIHLVNHVSLGINIFFRVLLQVDDSSVQTNIDLRQFEEITHLLADQGVFLEVVVVQAADEN